MNNYSTRTFRFGPGSLESVELRVWAHRRDNDHIIGRLQGIFEVYCGDGNTHPVQIDQRHDAWRPLEGWHGEEIDTWLISAFDGVQGSADNLAAQLVEFALEGWVDPCQEEA